ncbi:glycerophosphodiester phosphodiesterase family protein [Bosea sp. 2YAB26]|uniref:glycerophosphodiester phosphodiesterase family protein n=1 Tax=Bosea sp. 2YAB26 TaxID=3237478 RepID=UPI003F906036
MRRLPRLALAALFLLTLFILISNSSLLASRPQGRPTLLAHRGITQLYDKTDLRSDVCSAARMLPPRHDFIENTLPSMRAAFEAGADIVELDVHPTTDGQFAVFHDWTLECRTNGEGVTREHAMAQLKALDVGYGYTADGGRTHPLRGKGIGMMPTLDEVFAAFPGRRFAINVKSRDRNEGEKLAAVLGALPPKARARLIVYGGDEPVETLRRLRPDIPAMSRSTQIGCLTRYVAYGWTGVMPEICRGTIVLVPINIAPWLWGWPNRFLNRLDSAGTQVFALGPYQGGGFSTGLDTLAELSRLPAGYSGGIWTDEIAVIAGAVKPTR